MTSNWREATWGELATLEYGKALRDYKTSTGSVPVYGTNGPIGWTNKPLCPFPTVIIGRKGAYRGVHLSPSPCWVIDTAFYISPKQPLDIRWAYYQLLTQDINGMDSGSAIPSTSREEFYRLPVKVPPLAVQKQIADVLGTLDSRIANVQSTNICLESIGQAIFKSWFVDFDPVRAKAEGRDPEGVDEDTAAWFPEEFQDSELGPIPKGWRVDTIDSVISCVGGSTPSTKEPAYWNPPEYHWVTPKDLSGQSTPVLLTTERMISEAGLKKISSGLLPEGTLLLSSRAPIGYLAITKIPTAINQGFIAMPPAGQLSPEYMLFWSHYNLDTIKQHANGSTFMEISKAAFRKIKLVVPPAQLVNRFTQIAQTVLERIAANERYRMQLVNLRDTLLPRLIAGKLRVPEAEEALKEVL
ncbi:restriction endonuclease subunit S [Symbiobacterium thermophilum]|uniref:restriction endonuclease subunit S n=1 Tax=Symbiobacterium thermophilum TaxID=2734 RepID=UPI0002DCC3E9|nr:restriction endonuclease subunit S [Symbiobacterium thermophilum]